MKEFRAARPNQFVEFRLNSCPIAILCVLNDEDHKKRNDRRACVDDELPSIGELNKADR